VKQEEDKRRWFSVSEADKAKRLDAFLALHVQGLTRSRVQDLIKSGFVRVNQSLSKPGYRLKPGDHVEVTVPSPEPLRLAPEAVAFEILHEDPWLIVVNKPPGVVVHPAPGHFTGTLVHGLLGHCKDLSGIGGVMRPGIVHRLDKDTSGLMVVAKNDAAHAVLSRQFKSGQITKRYVALVHGIPKERQGEIHLPIGRHPVRRKEMSVQASKGRMAKTLWEKKEELAGLFSVLVVSPKTGRTHQIRVHLSHIGYPIVGDPVYGYRRSWWKKRFSEEPEVLGRIERHMLHAGTLGFVHPQSGEYREFTAPVPPDMELVLEMLRKANLSPIRVQNVRASTGRGFCSRD
jgi:23S rRNA pseudouridine1911/1915/1917 synthase